jgi:hypothetical protein
MVPLGITIVAWFAVSTVKLVGDAPMVAVSVVVDIVGDVFKSLILIKSPDTEPPKPIDAPIPIELLND